MSGMIQKAELQTSKEVEYRQQMIDEIIDCLERDVIPWEKCWNEKRYRPYNAATNIAYRGLNNANLSIVSMARGYKDPRFMTFQQAKQKGYRIKQGSKCINIAYWTYYSFEEKKSLSVSEWNRIPAEEQLKYKLIVKKSQVFNAECIDGIPPLQIEEFENKKIDCLEKAVGNIVKNIGLFKIKEGYGKAAYIPSEDSICIPDFSAFHDEKSYYSTLFHELAHATGHPQRLNRDLSGRFGSESYAIEELRAEIASMFLAQDFSMELDRKHIDNHKAYIQSWLKTIKKQPMVLFKAIKEAEGIASYMERNAEMEKLLEYDKNKSQKKETVLEKNTEKTKNHVLNI